MYKLFPHCRIVTGNVASCVYDLIGNQVYEIDTALANKLMAAQRRAKASEFTPSEIGYLKWMEEKKLLFQSEANLAIEAVRMGVPPQFRTLYGQHGGGLGDVFVVITGSCRQNCSFCDESRRVVRMTGCKKWNMEELLREDDYYSALEASRRAGARNLHILGGDPVLRGPLLERICGMAKSLGFVSILLYTTGQDASVSDPKYRYDLLVIHLTAFDENTYAATCRTGSFGALRSNLELFRRNNARIYFNICVVPELCDKLESFRTFIDAFEPAGFGCSYVYPADGTPEGTPQLYDARGKTACFSDLFYFHAETFHPCLYGKLSVFADGTVTVCPMMRDEPIGNLRTESMASIIQARAYLKYWDLNLDKLESCGGCGFRYACMDCRAIEKSRTGRLTGKQYCDRAMRPRGGQTEAV